MDTNLVLSLVILLLVVIGFVSGKFRLGLVGMAGARPFKSDGSSDL